MKSVEAEKGKFNKVVLKDTTTQTADACIVATGGLSLTVPQDLQVRDSVCRKRWS